MTDDWIRRHGDVHACEDAADQIAEQSKQREQEQNGGDDDRDR